MYITFGSIEFSITRHLIRSIRPAVKWRCQFETRPETVSDMKICRFCRWVWVDERKERVMPFSRHFHGSETRANWLDLLGLCLSLFQLLQIFTAVKMTRVLLPGLDLDSQLNAIYNSHQPKFTKKSRLSEWAASVRRDTFTFFKRWL